MTAISVLRAKAAEKYKPYEIDFENGTTATLKSILELDKDELALFNTSTKRLSELGDADEDQDLEVLREEFVTTIAGVSTDKAAVAAALESETLGLLTILFEEYARSANTGAKSESDS